VEEGCALTQAPREGVEPDEPGAIGVELDREVWVAVAVARAVGPRAKEEAGEDDPEHAWCEGQRVSEGRRAA
jgi:hypothetical protein